MWRVVRAPGLVAILAIACADAPDETAEREVPVRVGSVGVDRFDSPVVILEERDGSRLLPIWIGAAEATSIATHLHHKRPPRPNFHDLAQRLIQSLDAEVVRVVVTELRSSTYYATLVLRTNGRLVEIDVRPSDGIAVAVRLDAPILVRESLFEHAEKDLRTDDSGRSISFGPRGGSQPTGNAPATPELKL
jgi:bifunctional DNase/RNase